MGDSTFSDVNKGLHQALMAFPDSIETRTAVIAVGLNIVMTFAKNSPREIREHWAKVLYQHADELAARDDD